ncbi:hypothetical protein ACUUL3_16505 [Thiovibrio sp. JS02]
MVGAVCSLLLLLAGCARQPAPAELPAEQATGAIAVPVLEPPARDLGSVVQDEPAPAEVSPPAAALPSRSGRSSAECYPAQRSARQIVKGRCEPQSLPFARCRSGIDTCRLGVENGPLTWFACEERRGNTSAVPRQGSILILAANARRKMPTGHVAYVEEVVQEGATTFRLIFSHTNYDRKCSLETGITATYDLAARSIDIESGAWRAWGKKLAVAGFILD